MEVYNVKEKYDQFEKICPAITNDPILTEVFKITRDEFSKLPEYLDRFLQAVYKDLSAEKSYLDALNEKKESLHLLGAQERSELINGLKKAAGEYSMLQYVLDTHLVCIEMFTNLLHNKESWWDTHVSRLKEVYGDGFDEKAESDKYDEKKLLPKLNEQEQELQKLVDPINSTITLIKDLIDYLQSPPYSEYELGLV
jgi:hypothetical protein